MSLYSYGRSVIRTSVCLAASLSFGSAADRLEARAQLLDQAEFLCANCFFGASEHYYCFAADNEVLIGYQKTPVLNWQDKTKNYLTPIRPRWTAWTAPGQSVLISYDRKHIWVTRANERQARAGLLAYVKGIAFWVSRADDKRVRLSRSSLGDIFMNNETCRNAGTAKAH